MAIVDLVYFGSLREALGRDGERIDPPSHVLTVEDLLNWMSERGAPYRSLLSDNGRLSAAVEREHAGPGDTFFRAQEVAPYQTPGPPYSISARSPPISIHDGSCRGPWSLAGAPHEPL